MKLLIVGGNGYVGNALVENLSPRHEVIATARNPFSIQHQVEKVPLDITDYQQAKRLLARYRPDAVIHAAGMPKRAKMDKARFMEVNVEGTAALAAAIREESDADFVYVSSGCAFKQIPGEVIRPDSPREYGNPFSVSKNSAEERLLELFQPAGGQRLHILYSPVILHPSQKSGIIPYALKDAVKEGLLYNKVPEGHVNFAPHTEFATLIEKLLQSSETKTINQLPITGIRQPTRQFFANLKGLLESQLGKTIVVVELPDPNIETMCLMDEAWVKKIVPDFEWGKLSPHITAITERLGAKGLSKEIRP